MRIITHQDMIEAGQTGCYGSFDYLPVYQQGRLVDREWYCKECGLSVDEMGMMMLLGGMEEEKPRCASCGKYLPYSGAECHDCNDTAW